MSNTTEKLFKGGGFLLEDMEPAHIFTLEDLTEEQQMIARTTKDFVEKEVLPYVDEIEQHQFQHTTRLLKKAGELGLLGADVPEEYGGLGLDKISSTLISEEFSKAGAFGLSHGAHVGIGTLPIVFLARMNKRANTCLAWPVARHLPLMP